MEGLRRHLTFANVASALALVIALGTGGAYAASTVFSSDIVDGEVKIADIGRGAVATSEVLDDTATGGGLTAADLRAQSVGPSEAAGLTGGDIAGDSLKGADVDESSLVLADGWGSFHDAEGAVPAGPNIGPPRAGTDDILSLDLPPGSFLLIAKVALSQATECRLYAEQDFDDFHTEASATIAGTVLHRASGSFTAHLACASSGSIFTDAKIHAIRLSNVALNLPK